MPAELSERLSASWSHSSASAPQSPAQSASASPHRPAGKVKDNRMKQFIVPIDHAKL